MSAAAVAASIPAPPESVEGDETVEETAPEGVEAAETPPAETDAPAEGATEEPAAAATEIPEEQLKVAAEKYAADAVKRANTTMAAARRAEARTEAVKAENASLKQASEKQLGDLRYAADFIGRLQRGDPSALTELGFASFRDFATAVSNFGEPTKPETAETRLERLERERQEEREANEQRSREEGVRAAQTQVFGFVDADKTRWRLTATPTGHDIFWDTLREYHQLHGSIPDDMVPVIADAVEADMRAEFGAPAPAASAPRPGATNGASPASTGRNPKTLTAKGAAAAPGSSEYSQDPVERDRQVNARLKAEGLL